VNIFPYDVTKRIESEKGNPDGHTEENHASDGWKEE
jgi:hypothetical protein